MKKHIIVETIDLLPVQFKITPLQIYSAPTIPPGGWSIFEGPEIPSTPESINAWFRKSFQVKNLEKEKRNCIWSLRLWFGNLDPAGYLETAEGAVWVDGKLIQGIDYHHRDVFLEKISTDYQHTLTVRVKFDPQQCNRRITTFQLRLVHFPCFQLYHRLRCLIDTIKLLNPADPDVKKIAGKTLQIVDRIPFTDPGSDDFYRAVDQLNPDDLVVDSDGKKARSRARVFGHAHLDVCWLWPLKTTRLKAVNTFANACKMLREYPDFTFLQSQPALYEFVEKMESELFERVKRFSNHGRWIPEGSSWVEHDCNLLSGESLIRQLIYGKKYFSEKFHVDTRILWLPDTFGFNANMPQIMKNSGVEYFATSKLSWGGYTRFPHDTFRWVGIDGSEVLAFMLTARVSEEDRADYNCPLTPEYVKGAWETYAQKYVHDEVMIPFGYGDGGAGPNREMMERKKAMSLAASMPGTVSGSPLQTFKSAEKKREELPTWRGELYLEYHRGVYTSRSEIKKQHRLAEGALLRLERVTSLKSIHTGKPVDPDLLEKLKILWKKLLINQFHDVIAGSSIHQVNVEAVESLGEVVVEAEKITRQIIHGWTGAREIDNGEKPDELIYFNPHPWRVPVAMEISGEKQCALVELEPMNFTRVNPQTNESAKKIPGVQVAGENRVRNQLIDLKINKQGEILSLFDTERGEELIEEGKAANRINFYEDRPTRWDAWEIDESYRKFLLETPQLIESGWVESGPAKAVFRTIKKFRNSKIRQDLVVHAHTARIDFDTTFEWQEKNILVRADFPANVNAERACYGIPFGYVTRPNHQNRPSDQAMFEVPGLGWAALTETGGGLAILSNSKFGYSASGGSLSITLLKSAVYPDPDGEAGEHSFSYSILPLGDFRDFSYVTREAAQNFMPYISFKMGKSGEIFLPRRRSLMSVKSDKNHVFCAALKPAEDGNGVIIRLYEGLNRRGIARLTLPKNIKKIVEVNFLEKETGVIDLPAGKTGEVIQFDLKFKPFQIRTFRVTFGG